MVVDNSYYSEQVHGPFQLADIGDLPLEEGATLRACQLAYQTLGELNAAKDNAVLIPTWYSGNHSVMRDTYVGPGRTLDPERYHIVLVNQLGSGLGTSPHSLAGPYGQARFPRVRIGDDVVAQERLLREHLGVEELALVFGGSMGAQQTYEWAVRFPDRVKRAAPLAGTARMYQHCVNWAQTLVETLQGDPGWAGGWYERSEDVRAGLSRHAGLFALYVLSNRFWTEEHWRALGFSSPQDFRIGFLEGLLRPDGRKRPALPGVEVAARRRQPPHRRRPRGRSGAHHREDVRDADQQRPVLPTHGLRGGTGARRGQRAAGHRGRARARVAVRPQPVVRRAGGRRPARPARAGGLSRGDPAQRRERALAEVEHLTEVCQRSEQLLRHEHEHGVDTYLQPPFEHQRPAAEQRRREPGEDRHADEPHERLRPADRLHVGRAVARRGLAEPLGLQPLRRHRL